MAKEINLSERENFKKICLVSSAAFSAASCVWPWTAPIGAGLGLYASIDTGNHQELEKEFTDAVDTALKKTQKNLTTLDSRRIIEELSSDIVRPDNIDNLISETETYRRQYCTVLDRKRIVDMFEMYFKEEICKCNALSNYYLLAAGTVTLETIKSVNCALIRQEEKLSTIRQGVDEINDKTTNILTVIRTILCECGFILIAVACCLLLALFLDIHVPLFYLQVIACYSLSSLFTSSILKVIKSKVNEQRITDYVNSNDRRYPLESSSVFNSLMQVYIYSLVSIGVYLTIYASQPIGQHGTILSQLCCVVIGSIISCSLKAMLLTWIKRLEKSEKVIYSNSRDSEETTTDR